MHWDNELLTYGRGCPLAGKRRPMGLGAFNASIRAATNFDLCSRESRCRRCADAIQSETACRLGIVVHTGVMEGLGYEERGVLKTLRRSGWRGAILGILIVKAGRASRESRPGWMADFIGGWPLPIEKV